MATHEMIKINVDSAGGVKSSKAGNIELNDKVFGQPVRVDYFWEVVRSMQFNKRSGNASTKTFTTVRGGGRKPFRQKGTGRARAGSRRSPLWKGGAVTFGPHPRDWSYDVNKKLRRKALSGAISARQKEGNLIVVEAFDLPEIKTKLMSKILKELGVTNALIVHSGVDKTLARSARNIQKVKVIEASRLNVYDVLLYKHLIFTKAGLEAMEGGLNK